MLRTPLIKVKGDAYDRGLKYGSEAKKFIDHNIEYYGNYCAEFLGLNWKEAIGKIESSISKTEEYDVEIFREMEGIAEGAGRKIEDIFVLNARYELAITSIAKKYLEGCTSYSFTPEVTKSGHVLLGQNWDFMHGLQDSCVFLLVEREDGPDILMHLEAGTVGHKGLNSAGLGLCINALISNEDKIEPAIPLITVISRKIMNSERLRDAILAVLKAERSASINFMIAHSGGEILDLEITPNDVYFLYPDQGILTHSNNFLTQRCNIKDLGKISFPDSITRWHRLKRLLKPKSGQIDYEDIRKAASDHFDYPYSLCRHLDKTSKAEYRFETIFSMIMDLNEGTFYFTEGNPCENKYQKVPFKFK